jgi:4-amino-4-deoxy-L-arabinose transferase-like glycosyltransferase
MKSIFDLLRRNKLFFLLATIAALALRLFFVFRFPHVAGDSLVYGDIAKNWLHHGIYGLTAGTTIRPTLIRMPGYPAFLSLIFSLAGQDHYGAALIVQAFIDTNVCLVIAALSLELFDERAAKAAYLLAALCPFTANYSAAALSETLSIGCTAHALYYGIRGLKALHQSRPGRSLWMLAGLWTAAGILMRPDGGLVLVPFGLALIVCFFRSSQRKQVFLAGVLLAVTTLGLLVPWTVRNWRTFHVFQPLTTPHATDPGESVLYGVDRWVKSWIVDYASVEDVAWHIEGEPVDFNLLPERAFDSRLEYDKTQELISQYNNDLYVSPELDSQFNMLASERISHNPFRYYVWLPSLRIASMWLRPRTEILGFDPRWWDFESDPQESTISIFLAAINLFLLLAALRGWLKHRLGIYGLVLIGFVALRSAFLGTLGNPEPRYMLECFPVVLALAGGAFRGDKFFGWLSSLLKEKARQQSRRALEPGKANPGLENELASDDQAASIGPGQAGIAKTISAAILTRILKEGINTAEVEMVEGVQCGQMEFKRGTLGELDPFVH